MSGKQNEYQPQRMEIDLVWLLADLLAKIRKRRILYLVLIIAAGAAFSLFAEITYKPYYESSIVFTVKTAFSENYELFSEDTGGTNNLGKYFSAVLTSDALRTLVAKDMGYESVDDFTPAIMASSVNNTNLVNLRTRAEYPDIAEETLHKVLENYKTISLQTLGEVELEVLFKSTFPQKPANEAKIIKTGVKGAICCSFILLVLGCLSSIFNNTIRNENDLIRYIDPDWCGILPFTNKEDASADFTDCIRSLRNYIEKAMYNSGTKIIMVTSALPGEGKSKLAENLAVVLKERNARILLKNDPDGDADYIIVDAPAFMEDPEVLEIAEKADACILVVRRNYTHTDAVCDTAAAIRDMGCSIIGCVLNCADPFPFT